ncbi:MAG: cyclic pyranopterin monophosphate synthase MoaC [SAR202 cluster bacterium]|nr:cyclic pyranopterin monophosphate synthase MoaC [SAR202 cluster bacterium]|tara:strand:- start:48983 stop:49933 length:951 start_codon:yes stop_codon:yes gene_type:complete
MNKLFIGSVKIMIRVYTDGSCLNNPGAGGWAAIILDKKSKMILKGGENNTTNNRMELMSVISGLESIADDEDVTIYSDSKYVINSVTLGWKRKANLDLWELLDQQLISKNVEWQWVKGHSGDKYNEEADQIAQSEADKIQNNINQPSYSQESLFKKVKMTHLDDNGEASMVNVASKEKTIRKAEAKCTVVVGAEVLKLIIDNQIKKGDVFSTANIAGIMAAKKASNLIPLCHTILLDKVGISFEIDQIHHQVHVTSVVESSERTGVEIEALVAASVAGITIYDMCKSVDKKIHIDNLHLVKKTGGKSGDFDIEKTG